MQIPPKKDVLLIAMRQCALEMNSTVEDFSRQHNVITLPKANEGRRHFISGTFFFRMLCFGGNAVISADERLHPWLSDYVRDKVGHWLFEEPHQIAINRVLEAYGKSLWLTIHSYLPAPKEVTCRATFEVKWFEKEEIPLLYENPGFPNALQYDTRAARPDVLAVASYDGSGSITGVAGASADTQHMWQVGVDVSEQYRGQGIATCLVTLLRSEILKRGRVPYYSTSGSNIYSQIIAMNSGFFPAWVDACSREPRGS